MKRTIIAAAAMALMTAMTGAATAQRMTRADYIERYAPVATAHAEKYGIPASVKMAQGILESGDGNGRLAREANSHFNIKVKAADNWRGAVIRHDDDAPNEAFRAYGTAEESWEDHSRYLDTQPRYDSLFRHGPTNYRAWARGLKNAGYATDPLYAEKLIRIIEENELWRLDRGEEPTGPTPILATATATTAMPATGGATVDPDRFVITIEKRKRR